MSRILADLINEVDAAKILNIGRRSLQAMRYDGTGPAFIKLSHRRVAYEESELQRWIDSRRVDPKSSEKKRP